MKKIISVGLIIALTFSGCNKKQEKTLPSDTNLLDISSTSEPIVFSEDEVMMNEKYDINDLFIGEKGLYITTNDIMYQSDFRFFRVNKDMEKSDEICTELVCSYVYDACCSDDEIYVCYDKDQKTWLSALDKLTGDIIRTTELKIYSYDFQVEYSEDNIIVSYGTTDEIPMMLIDVYNKDFTLKDEKVNICEKVGKPEYMGGMFTASESGIDCICVCTETLDVGFIHYSYEDKSYTFIPSGVDFSAGYEPEEIYNLGNDRILFKYTDLIDNMTYLNVYNCMTSEITDMYEIDSDNVPVIQNGNDYVFLSEDNCSVLGYGNDSDDPDKLFDMPDDYWLGRAFYDFRTENIFLYNTKQESKVNVHKISEGSFDLISSYELDSLFNIRVSEDDNVFTMLEDENNYQMKITDGNGKYIKDFTLNFPEETSLVDFYPYKNSIYLITNNGDFFLAEYDFDGNKISENILNDVSKIHCIYTDKSGDLNIYANTYEGNAVITYEDTQFVSKKLNERMTYNYYQACPSAYTDDFVFMDENGIYSYCFEEKTIIRLVDLNNQSMSCSAEKVLVADNDSFIVAGLDYITGKTAVSVMKRSYDETTKKEIINIAEVGTTNIDIKTMIRKYNKTNTDYQVRIKNYENQSDFIEALGKGEVPDIITYQYDSGFDLKSFIEEGYVQELDEYIRNDEEVNEDEYFLNVLKLAAYPEHIYQLGSAADFDVLVLDKNYDFPLKWNTSIMSDMFSLHGSQLLEPVRFIPTQDWIKNYLLKKYINENIDHKKERFNGDADIISSMLEYAALYRSYADDEGNENDSEEYILKLVSLSGMQHDFDMERILPIPSAGESVCEAYIRDKMLLMKSSSHKEEAYKIMRTILLDEYQDESRGTFPIKKSKLSEEAEKRREIDKKYDLPILTKEQEEIFMGIMSDACSATELNYKVSSFVDKSYNEVVSEKISASEASKEIINCIEKFLQES